MLNQDIMTICGLDDHARSLSKIYCKESVSHQELNSWFSSVDFEALSPQVTCMASCAGVLTSFEGIAYDLVPRLKGIVRYVHTLNSGMYSGIWALCAKMNEAALPLHVSDDTALCMYYSKEPQRHLWQTFASVRNQDLRQVLKIARDAGFDVEEYPYAAILRKGMTQQMLITAVPDTHYLWQNATEIRKGNATLLCASPQATFLEVSKRAFRALTKPYPRAALICWFMDMRVLASNFKKKDWQQLAELAARENVSSHMRLLLSLYTAHTGADVEYIGLFSNEKEAERLVRLLMKYRALSNKSYKIQRFVLSCRLRRPDSLYHTGRLCLKEGFAVLRCKITRKS